MRWFREIALAAVAVSLAACGGNAPAATSSVPAAQAPPPAPAAWVTFKHLPGVVDIAGPRAGGAFVVSAAGQLSLFRPDGTLTPFARGRGGYQTAKTAEPYLTLVSGVAVPGSHCSFRAGTAYALEPGKRPEIMVIAPQGRAMPFTSLPAATSLSGITYDGTGGFGHRLLVVAGTRHGMTVFGIGCDGRPVPIAAGAPRVEGGIAVAPPTFGRFAGDLIAPDEVTGLVYAIDPVGRVTVLARSGRPAGGDIGAESAGFVPPAVTAAYLADRFSPGNKHPGDNVILRLSATALATAGIKPGDLLVATEASAQTVDIRCAASCTARYVADGPAIAHAEGHIAFAVS